MNENDQISADENKSFDYFNENNKLIDFIKENKLSLIIVSSFIIVIFAFLALANSVNNLNTESKSANQEESSTQTEDSKLDDLLNEDSPEQNQYQEPTPEATAKPIATSTPSSTATPAPTSIPRPADPPKVNISYPQENQTIELKDQQRLCVVDTPTGGNTEGLQRREMLSGSQWTPYYDVNTLCYFPKEGNNTIQLQYKNKYGDESQIYTRNFTFHKIELIDISINGELYRDVNCNGVKDIGEGNIGTTATINIFKHPEFYVYRTLQTNGSGIYSFTGPIYEDEEVRLQPSAVSPPGYKSNPTYTVPIVTMNKNNRSETINIPQVPNESIESCQIP